MTSPFLPLINISLVVTALSLVPAGAAAQCAAPSSSGVAICQPSSNSTVTGVPHIEAAATPTSGSISEISVILDGKLLYQNAGPQMSLFPGGVPNGTHHMVIQAKDDFGRSYQSSETFSVTGNPPSSCAQSGAGVRICYPASGQVVSQNLYMALGFKGTAPVNRVQAFVDNKLVFDFAPSPGQNQVLGSGSGTTAGTHTLKVVATDTAHHTYTSSVPFKAYFDGDCPPKGTVCTSGIYLNTPQDGQDVTSPFRVSASIENNPSPITTVKIYMNGRVAAISSGPTIDQFITSAKGTYIMVIQGWDSKGKLYRLSENVNVQ